jgi:hypothetical protein
MLYSIRKIPTRNALYFELHKIPKFRGFKIVHYFRPVLLQFLHSLKYKEFRVQILQFDYLHLGFFSRFFSVKYEHAIMVLIYHIC